MTAEIRSEADSGLLRAPAGEAREARRGRPSAAGAPAAAGRAGDEARAEGAKARRRRRRRRRIGWRSPLTRRILLLNLLVLVIPVVGLMHLDQYRQSLIAAELDGLRTQGRSFALSLGSTTVVASTLGSERLMPEMTRRLMRVLLASNTVRARIFAPDGELIADSFVLAGPGGQVTVVELPPPDDGSALGWAARTYDYLVNWLPGLGDLPSYREAPIQSAADYEEVERALAGESPGMVRLDRGGRLVLSVAVPVQRYRKVLGALMLSKDGADIMAAVGDRRQDILFVFAVAFAVTVLLSLYLAGTIARPILRLASAADLVRYGKGRQYEIPDFTHRDDEIGDLSAALREMTAALWERLDAIEGFAADVAHEIKNPLTSLRSAVETVARVEDPEQQKRLMSIILDDVQRLDRLISDISDASRLDAELSRAESEAVDVGELLQTLAEVHKTTAGEDGPHFQLDLPGHYDLIVSGLEGRLGQVFRNLISNAVSFSPPGGEIRLSARREQGVVWISVSDQGPGMPPDKLDAIFNRFYTERPKGEKFGTHSGLGLSISRQIVEAHGGSIRAENQLDESGAVIGARFVVRLPAD
jgi:two-component system sensor histidine kinase ChvG